MNALPFIAPAMTAMQAIPAQGGGKGETGFLEELDAQTAARTTSALTGPKRDDAGGRTGRPSDAIPGQQLPAQPKVPEDGSTSVEITRNWQDDDTVLPNDQTVAMSDGLEIDSDAVVLIAGIVPPAVAPETVTPVMPTMVSTTGQQPFTRETLPQPGQPALHDMGTQVTAPLQPSQTEQQVVQVLDDILARTEAPSAAQPPGRQGQVAVPSVAMATVSTVATTTANTVPSPMQQTSTTGTASTSTPAPPNASSFPEQTTQSAGITQSATQQQAPATSSPSLTTIPPSRTETTPQEIPAAQAGPATLEIPAAQAGPATLEIPTTQGGTEAQEITASQADSITKHDAPAATAEILTRRTFFVPADTPAAVEKAPAPAQTVELPVAAVSSQQTPPQTTPTPAEHQDSPTQLATRLAMDDTAETAGDPQARSDNRQTRSDSEPATGGTIPSPVLAEAPDSGTLFGNELETTLKSDATTVTTQPQRASGFTVSESQILQQVLDRFALNRRIESGSISLRLHPEELGELQLDVLVQRSTVQLQVTAQNPQVQELLERHLPRLKEALSQHGFSLDRMEVTLADSSQKELLWQDDRSRSSYREAMGSQAFNWSSRQEEMSVTEDLLPWETTSSGLNILA